MLTVVDYGVGNLFSLVSSLRAIGVKAVVTRDAAETARSDKIILPGVGAFADAAKKLSDSGLDSVIINEAKKGKPILGICLGMQLLFTKSYEYGEHSGLGLIDGAVKPLSGRIPSNLKIPHIGWNSLHFPKKNPLFKYTGEGSFVYFVHSYFADDCDSAVIAETEYGARITAAVARDNIFGCQFHPEKSGDVGLDILRAFCEIK